MKTTTLKSYFKPHLNPLFLLACLLWCVSAGPLFAGPVGHWNVVTGNWNTAANWTEVSVPTSGNTAQLFFNVAPGILTSTASDNNIAGTFVLNQLNFGTGANFSLTGNALQFNGVAPSLVNNNTGGVVTIANDISFSVATSFSGNAASSLLANGVVSGGSALTVANGLVTFGNAANTFFGGLNVTGGTARVNETTTSITINNTGSNSYFGQGAINVTGGRLIIQNTGAAANVTINRDLSFTNASATAANPNLIQAGNILTMSSRRTTFLDNGSNLKISSLTGTLTLDNSTFNFGTNGGTLTIAGNLFPVATAQNYVVNTTNGNAIVQYASKDVGNAWNDGSSFDMDIRNGRLSGTGNLLLDITGGAVIQYSALNFGGKLTFQGVSAGAGGSASAASTATNVGRIAFGDAATTTPQTFVISKGLFFKNYNQVTGYLPQSGGAYLGSNTIGSDITIQDGETAFAGTETGNVALAGAFPSRLQIGSSATNKLTINNGAIGTLDLSFFTDPTLGLSVNGVTLNSSTTINAGGMLQFKKTVSLAGATYDALEVKGSITGQGNAVVGQGESILNIQNSVATGSTLLFNNSVNLFVQGTDCYGLRVQGSKANVDGLLTSSFLQTHVLSVAGSTTDQGTLTIAYTGAGSPARTFTNADAPVAASFVRLGFGSNSNAPIYSLNATGGVGGSALSKWNGLVIKENATVALLSNVTFTGASAVSNTTFCLENTGTLDLKTFSANFSGNGDWESGTITQTVGNLGAVNIAGNAVKTTSGTVNLNGRLIASGTGPATGGINKGLEIVQGTISQGIDNAIIGGTNMTLAGGTYATNSHNQDAGLMGTLTLTATSYIDFGTSSTSKIHFANSSGTSGNWLPGDLILLNWNGTPVTGGGNTQLYFGSNPSGLTSGQLAQIWFKNPNGLAPGFYHGILLANGELVPVPEASTMLSALTLTLAALGYEVRRRKLKVCLQRSGCLGG